MSLADCPFKDLHLIISDLASGGKKRLGIFKEIPYSQIFILAFAAFYRSRNADNGIALGSCIYFLYNSGSDAFAFLLQSPDHPISGKVPEEELIVDLHPDGALVDTLEGSEDIAVLVANLISMRMETAVGSDNTIAVE